MGVHHQRAGDGKRPKKGKCRCKGLSIVRDRKEAGVREIFWGHFPLVRDSCSAAILTESPRDG